jgi:hypothetical protein
MLISVLSDETSFRRSHQGTFQTSTKGDIIIEVKQYVFWWLGGLAKPTGKTSFKVPRSPIIPFSVMPSLSSDSLLLCEASLTPVRFYAVRRGLGGYTDTHADCPRNVQKSCFGRPIFQGSTCPYPITKQCHGWPITPYKPVTYQVKTLPAHNSCGSAPLHHPN